MPRKRDYHSAGHPSLWNGKEEIEQEKKSFRKTILFFVFLIILGLIIYALIFSKLFQIKNVEVVNDPLSGGGAGESTEIVQITQDFLEHKKFFVLPNSNQFLFSSRALENLLEKRFDLAFVEINKKWPKSIEIKVRTKFPVLVWQERETAFTVYSDGVIKNRIGSMAQYELPIVNRGTTTEVQIGWQMVSLEQLEFIEELNKLFNYYFKEIGVRQFVVQSLESREVDLITSEGWRAMFSLDLEIEPSLEILKEVLNQKIKDRGGLSYIDLRVVERVYYK